MTDLEEELGEYFAFLDGLRDSGETNMFGAGAYLEEEFEMKRHDARKIVKAWMETFDGSFRLSVDERVAKIDGLGE